MNRRLRYTDSTIYKSCSELFALEGKFSYLHTLAQIERNQSQSINNSSMDIAATTNHDTFKAMSPYFSAASQSQTLKSFAILENFIDKLTENKEEIDNCFIAPNEVSFRRTPEKNLEFYRNQNIKLKRIIIQIKVQMKSKIEEALNVQREEIKNIIDQYLGFIDKLMSDKKQLSKRCEEMASTIRLNTVTSPTNNQSR